MNRPPELAVHQEILTAGCGWVDVSHRTLLELEGSDRTSFLHNLTTNDIRGLAVDTGCESFLANVQGKVVGHGWVFCLADRLWFATVPGQTDALMTHLDRYLIREEVTFVDRADHATQLLLAGSQTPNILTQLAAAAPETPLSHTQITIAHAPVDAFQVPAWAPHATLLVIPCQHRAAVIGQLESAGALPCEAEALESHRVQAAFPAYGQDISADNLPQEVDRDPFAISFTKGCYLGQETVARIDAMGHVNRLLRCLAWNDHTEPPPPATPLSCGGKVVGQVTSACWAPNAESVIGLGYVRREHAQEGTEFETDRGPARIISPSHRE